MKKNAVTYLILTCVMFVSNAERIKDITDIEGVRGNPLTGVGLVVGLAGSGDTTLPSRQILTSIFRGAGLVLEPADLKGGNIAVVMVTAELGPFSREGSRIDVDVSVLGDAESLQGGMLLPTPLKGLDGQGLEGQVYAIASGALSTGGFSASGEKGAISKNHQNVARIPGGATIEKAEIADFVNRVGTRRFVTLNLRNSDFATARRINDGINNAYSGCAIVLDPGTIMVNIPETVVENQIASFIDTVTSIEVVVDTPAVVVINEKTGTIVVGENVGISTVAISQGSLVVKVQETASVSQPIAPFSDAGQTAVIPETLLQVEESRGYLIPVKKVVTVSELANELNAIGATPRDLIAIFNALKKAGALQARLEIM